jgi:hypothetical protein
MSDQVTAHFIKQYTDGIEHLSQQKGTRLRKAVRVESGIKGDRVFFDQMSATTTTARTIRHGDTVLTDTPHSRRMCTLITYDVADLVDEPDVLQVLNDPTNPYSMAMGMAMGRRQDDVIISALYANVSTGVDGAGTETFNSDGDTQIVHGSVGMTIPKILEAKRRLDSLEEDQDAKRWAACSAIQIEDLLNTTEVASADFNTVKALANGDMNTFAGFEWIQTERLGTSAANIRQCPFWIQDGMLLAVGMEPKGRIAERPDKNHSTQVFYTARFGAVRMRHKAVIEVQADEN